MHTVTEFTFVPKCPPRAAKPVNYILSSVIGFTTAQRSLIQVFSFMNLGGVHSTISYLFSLNQKVNTP